MQTAIVGSNAVGGCSPQRYTDESTFLHLAMIGMVETGTERDGKIRYERRCYLCPAKLDAEAGVEFR